MAAPGYPKSGNFFQPPAYFDDALEDAERLLKFASETGVDVPNDVRDHVLEARAASSAGWDESTASNLLTALTKLAVVLRPVTARSLEACDKETGSVVRQYYYVAICLAFIILPFSVASFVTSAIASTIRTDIAAANDLAVKLRAKLGPPNADAKNPDDPEVVTELQQYAADVRAIDRRAVQLNHFLIRAETDPNKAIRGKPGELHSKFELPKGLFNFSTAASNVTDTYQDVRYFAQSLLDDVSLFYGAITVCLLPVLYALLGTCAYLLRTFARQMTARTYTPYHSANSARFLVAAIGGAVVGLFNNFTVGQGASIPPLAIAFLVGYEPSQAPNGFSAEGRRAVAIAANGVDPPRSAAVASPERLLSRRPPPGARFQLRAELFAPLIDFVFGQVGHLFFGWAWHFSGISFPLIFIGKTRRNLLVIIRILTRTMYGPEASKRVTYA